MKEENPLEAKTPLALDGRRSRGEKPRGRCSNFLVLSAGCAGGCLNAAARRTRSCLGSLTQMDRPSAPPNDRLYLSGGRLQTAAVTAIPSAAITLRKYTRSFPLFEAGREVLRAQRGPLLAAG
ncbi:hypothetical protein EYF80_054264 [Liparis tanakae]|uniref:Uncharacterized protein n=1 Tax=Liparis tanakae TaxID=230148 RepID=A0A4Z2F345_9TELE|nr:hypothetical protein EYF80_054264 [Liparis tanakae]